VTCFDLLAITSRTMQLNLLIFSPECKLTSIRQSLLLIFSELLKGPFQDFQVEGWTP